MLASTPKGRQVRGALPRLVQQHARQRPPAAGGHGPGDGRAAHPARGGWHPGPRGVSLYGSTFSRTVWRLYGGAKGLVMWCYLHRVRGHDHPALEPAGPAGGAAPGENGRRQPLVPPYSLHSQHRAY
jgi:hypothetical protein